jgi:bacteriocin-like protein
MGTVKSVAQTGWMSLQARGAAMSHDQADIGPNQGTAQRQAVAGAGAREDLRWRGDARNHDHQENRQSLADAGMREKTMSKTMKPREVHKPSKAIEAKKSGAELDEKELEKVSGGKPCVTGQHIKTGIIIT